jgi:hypothetical protein
MVVGGRALNPDIMRRRMRGGRVWQPRQPGVHLIIATKFLLVKLAHHQNNPRPTYVVGIETRGYLLPKSFQYGYPPNSPYVILLIVKLATELRWRPGSQPVPTTPAHGISLHSTTARPKR